MEVDEPKRRDGFSDCSDEELLEACISREKNAWKEFVERFTNLIFYVIKYRCGYKNEDAEEIYQSVFVKILKNINRVREKERLRSWILAITWNECIDFSRKRSVLYKFFLPEDTYYQPSRREPEYYLSLRELLGHFKKAFAKLSPRNQDILSEKYKGSTAAEISEKLKIPKGSINYNHKKACRELSAILESMNYDYQDFKEVFADFLLPIE